jgi:hypothetical protein
MPRDHQPPCAMPKSQADTPRRSTGSLVDIKAQQTLAKVGVLAALGVLVWTGMQRPRRRYMPLHTWTGMALIGLTLWHWSLYLPRSAKLAGSPRPGPKSSVRPRPSGHAAEG